MDSLQGIKVRLGAVKNVGKITKAMEVVAATKMRKAQEVALRTRPYAVAALELLARMARLAVAPSVYMTPRETKKTLVILVASDRGLTGSFNAQVPRLIV